MVQPCEEDGNHKIAKRVSVGKCAGICSTGRLRKRWIDNVNECLKKKVLDVSQARKTV